MSDRGKALINFYQSLFGMHRAALADGGPENAALDIELGTVYHLDPDFPDGDMILATYPSGRQHLLNEFKVTEILLLRHARAMAVVDGGDVKRQHQHIVEHMGHKVGR